MFFSLMFLINHKISAFQSSQKTKINLSRDYSFSKFAKFSEKLTLLTP